MNAADQFLQDFHRQHPGCTRVAFAEGKSLIGGQSSYQLLAGVAPAGPVLDLGCGDGFLLSLLGKQGRVARSVGVDFSEGELERARSLDRNALLVRAASQALPFPARSFAGVVSHFAFHLMSKIESVVDEIARVLVPGGHFAAIVGGGPKVGDSFELFLDLLRDRSGTRSSIPRIGDMRTRTEIGLAELFAQHPAFEGALQIDDFYIDFGGVFDELWPRLAVIYDLAHDSEEECVALRAAFRRALDCGEDQHIPCTMAVRRIVARRLAA